jgi:ribosomal protein S8
MSVLVDKNWIKQNAYKNDKETVSINTSQCTIVGLNYTRDIKKGWLTSFEPITISNASAELFIRLKGANKKQQKEVIKNFKQELKYKTLDII